MCNPSQLYWPFPSPLASITCAVFRRLLESSDCLARVCAERWISGGRDATSVHGGFAGAQPRRSAPRDVHGAAAFPLSRLPLVYQGLTRRVLAHGLGYFLGLPRPAHSGWCLLSAHAIPGDRPGRTGHSLCPVRHLRPADLPDLRRGDYAVAGRDAAVRIDAHAPESASRSAAVVGDSTGCCSRRCSESWRCWRSHSS